MRPRVVWTIFRKELTEALRDRVTLLILIGLPLVLYPLLVIGVTKVSKTRAAAEDRHVSQVAVWGTLPPELREWFERTNRVALHPWKSIPPDLRADFETGRISPPVEKPPPGDGPARPGRDRRSSRSVAPASPVVAAAGAALEGGDVDAILVLWPGFAEAIEEHGLGRANVYYDSVRPSSENARGRVEEAMSAFQNRLVRDREAARSLPSGFSRALEMRAENVAPPRRQAGHFLGMALPFLLVAMAAVSAMYPAIDLTAGEKDRATMQTLLCAPVHAFEIALGKFLTVWAVSLISAFANTASLGLTLGRMVASVGGLSLSPLTCLLAAGCLVPVTFTISALFLAVAALGRDAKDAGNFLSPTLTVLLVPMSVIMLPGVELDAWTALAPLINLTLLMKGLFIESVATRLVWLTLGAAVLYALLAVLLAARAFSREEVLLGGRGGLKALLFAGPGERGRPPGPWAGLVAFALAGVAAYYGSWLPERLGVPAGVVLMQVGAFLLPVFALAALQGFPLRDSLSWRWPGRLNLLGCGLVGVSASVAIAGLILRLVPPPEAELQGLRELLLFGETPGALALAWAVLALTPALCEETLFRGLILASLRRWGAWSAILGSALLFGLAHASIHRLLPTVALGVVFGYAVWRTRSLPCSMVMHALNNGLIATLVWWQARTPGVKLDDITMVPWPLTLGAAAVAAVGLALLRPAADPKAG